jgi:hypothetical protein
MVKIPVGTGTFCPSPMLPSMPEMSSGLRRGTFCHADAGRFRKSIKKKLPVKPVYRNRVRIRIRIHMFLSLNPDPLSEVWIRIRILLSASKNSKKNLDSYCFVTSFGLFYL